MDLVGLNTCALRTNARYRAASQVRRRHTETKRATLTIMHFMLLQVSVMLLANGGGSWGCYFNSAFRAGARLLRPLTRVMRAHLHKCPCIKVMRSMRLELARRG